MKQIKKCLSAVLAAALLLSLIGPVTTLAAATPRDTRGHWAESFVKSGIDRGYINGYEDGSFKPNNAVSRAEFCKLINNAIGITARAGISFNDVSTSSWYYDEVRCAVGAGYINGYEDNSFRADNKITRQEAAVVISRIVTPPDALSGMSDITDRGGIASWAENEAKAVYAKGYMTGDERHQYRPTGNLTRAEAVKIIESILGAEKIVTTDLTISSGDDRSYKNTIYTGDVTISSNITGTVGFQNCRILGTLTASGSDTVSLEDSGVNQLSVNNSDDATEIRASGLSYVKHATLYRGGSLTETSLTGDGFTNVTLSGSNLKNKDVYLTGAFNTVTMNNPTTLNLSGGTIVTLSVASGATDSSIYLAKNTRVKMANVSAACEFTGSGNITTASVGNYAVSFETQPDNMTGGGILVPTVSPKNGATEVSLSSKITLTFSETLYSSSGKSLTAALAEDVVELRRGSESGTRVPFTVSVNSGRSVITLTPDSDLLRNTEYYIILLKSSLQNDAGKYNSRQVFSFNTGSVLGPATNPVDGGDMVPADTNITLQFPEAVYAPSGSSTTSLTAAYLQDNISLRKSTSSGSTVSFTAAISSDRKTVTITPKNTLSLDTRYYVSIAAGKLCNNDKEQNKLISFSFTTADTDVLVPTIDPASGSTDVGRNTAITLTFSNTLYTSNGSTGVDADYLEDEVFTLRRGSSSGTVTAFTASIDKNRRVLTITPDEQLRADSDYYLTMERGSLANASGSSRDTNVKMTFHFTTQSGNSTAVMEPLVSPKNGVSGVSTDSNIVLTFDEKVYNTSANTPNNAYLQSAIELRRGSSTGTKISFSAGIAGNTTVTLTPASKLDANTRYYVIVKEDTLQNSAGTQNARFSSYFTTGSGVALSATMTPAHGAVGVSPSAEISLVFSDTPLNVNSATLRASYVESTVVKLYEGSIASANARSFSASVSNKTITIIPDKAMTKGKVYYVVITKDTLCNSDGVKNGAQTYSFTVGSGLALSTTPANGATNIDRGTTVRLAFGEKLYLPGGTALDLSRSDHVTHVKSNVTLTGSSAVSYTPSLSGNTLILTPTSSLAANTKHTLTVKSGAFLGASGITNDAYTITFTTNSSKSQARMDIPGETLTQTSAQPTIRLYFDEAVTGVSTNTLKNADVNNAILIREGNATNGSLVAYTIKSIASDGKSFTIQPNAALTRGAAYYVILNANALQSNKVAYDKTTFSFAVAPASAVSVSSISPSGSGAGFGGNTIGLTFNDLVTDKNGSALAPAYVQNNFVLKENGVALTPAGITIGTVSGKTVITFTLTDKIKPGSAYAVTASAGILKNASGGTNTAISQSFSTKTPTVTLSGEYAKTGDSSHTATILVTSDYGAGSYTMTVGSKTVRSSFKPETPSAFNTTVTGLGYGTHTVELTYDYGASAPVTKRFDLIIAAPSDNATLSGIEIYVLGDGWTPVAITKGQYSYSASIASTASQVAVTPTATDPGASISMTANGNPASAGETVTMPESGELIVIITVTAPSGNTQDYTLTLTR